MKADRMPATGNYRCSGPKGFCVIDRRVQFDRVGPRNDLVKNCQRRVLRLLGYAFPFPAANQSGFSFDFAQTLYQRLQASQAQRFNQLISRCFVRIR